MTSRRNFLTIAAGASLGMAPTFQIARAQSKKLRFGVGPFLPSAGDTKKSFTPIFAHLAKQLGAADFDLQVSTDWAGLAVAMGSGQLDCAWMGPWGYIIANNATECQAVATVKYDGKATYQAIIIARPDLKVSKFPDDTRGKSIAFADLGSTSGWLIPTFYAQDVWKINPKTFWQYREGSSHPANEIAVQEGQVDLATDYDRNRNAMISSGRIKAESVPIVWTSDPLPNDAIAVPKTASAAMAAQVQSILASLTPDEAKALLPNRYTGFVKSSHKMYDVIERAGIAVGRIKAKA